MSEATITAAALAAEKPTRTITVRMPASLHQRLQRASHAESLRRGKAVSMNQIALSGIALAVAESEAATRREQAAKPLPGQTELFSREPGDRSQEGNAMPADSPAPSPQSPAPVFKEEARC